MKIGVSTLALYPRPLPEILGYLEERRVDYCEIINEYPLDEVEAADSHSIRFTVHAPISDINVASPNRAIRRASVSQVKGAVDLAVELDAEVVVVHPGSVPFLAGRFRELVTHLNLESLTECADYAIDNGVMICPENMPRMEGYLCSELEELWALVNAVDTGATLDVAHANTMGFSVDEMLSGNVAHIHLSDNNGDLDTHDALGTGSIDFKGLLKNLKSRGYDGVLTVEVKNPQEIDESLEFLGKLL